MKKRETGTKPEKKGREKPGRELEALYRRMKKPEGRMTPDFRQGKKIN